MDHLAGYPPTVGLLRTLHDSGEELCVCSVVVAEVYSGLRPEAILQARLLLDGLRYLETPEPAARLAGAWRYKYQREGLRLQTPDVLVAATALTHGAI
jgi:predicted nucleic acid-binding protein